MKNLFSQKLILSMALALVYAWPVQADQIVSSGHLQGETFEVNQIASGHSVPWGMEFISPHQLLITERLGRLTSIDIPSGKTTTISGLPDIYSEGQGGLLDIKKSPDYAQTGWIYFTYSKPNAVAGATTLARAKLASNRLVSWQDLFETIADNNTTRHYGSRIAFDQDGHIFVTVGDRGNRDNGQNLLSHAATILRLNLDGSIPADNPFSQDSNALDAIWSYGHRNPQGISFDPATGKLWSVEHGPRGGDEINLINKGNNYGWPAVSQGKEYWAPVSVGSQKNLPGMVKPKHVYIPSIAPSSLMIYRGDAFPHWQGMMFIGALAERHLNVIALAPSKNESEEVVKEVRLLNELNERIRNVITGPGGFIYLSTDSGRIFQMRPLASIP